MRLSDIDKTLLRYADSRSPAELSLIVDGQLTPEECAARVTVLLDQSDWLSLTQQDALVTHKMRSLIADLEALPLTARSAEVLLGGLEKLGNRLEKRATGIEQDLRRLYAWQGAVMIEALVIALEHIQRRIPAVSDYANHNEAEWNSVIEEALRRAGASLAIHEAGDRSPLPVASTSSTSTTSTTTSAPEGPSVTRSDAARAAKPRSAP